MWASNERTGEPYVDLMYSDIEPFRSAVWMGYPEGVHPWRALTSEETEDDDREV